MCLLPEDATHTQMGPQPSIDNAGSDTDSSENEDDAISNPRENLDDLIVDE